MEAWVVKALGNIGRLPEACPNPSVVGVRRQRSLSRDMRRPSGRQFLGAVLGLLALIGAITMSGWHGVVPDHHDDAEIAWSLASPDESHSPEIDLHNAAHAVTGIWADSGPKIFGSSGAFQRDATWLVRVVPFVTGGMMEALLRPPKG